MKARAKQAWRALVAWVRRFPLRVVTLRTLEAHDEIRLKASQVAAQGRDIDRQNSGLALFLKAAMLKEGRSRLAFNPAELERARTGWQLGQLDEKDGRKRVFLMQSNETGPGPKEV